MKSKKYTYWREIFTIIVITLCAVIISLGFKTFYTPSPLEASLVDILLSFIVLILSVLVFLLRRLEKTGDERQKEHDKICNDMGVHINLIKGKLDGTNQKIDEMKKIIKPQIPRDLSGLLKNFLEAEEKEFKQAFINIIHKHYYRVNKEMMYDTLIKFAKACSKDYGDHIKAVSSIFIEDFQKNPFARIYLDLNRECSQRGVPVQRIFILSNRQVRDKRVISIVREHGEALTGRASGVKWINKKQLKESQKNLDIAIFNESVIVKQDRDENSEIIINEKDEIGKALRTFDEIWNDPTCMDFKELMKGMR